MKALVTGAGGFIGSHLAEVLVERGWDVRAMLRYTSGAHLGALADVPSDRRDAMEIVFGDIQDPDYMDRVVKGVDVVFHLAALIAIPYSYHAPESYVQTNVLGTLNVLRAADRHKVSRVVQTSTSETYGTAQYVPIDEKHPLQGQSPYSASKIGADKLAESYFLSFELPVVTVRPFNTFGPRQSLRAVIPTIISQVLAGGPIRLGSLDPRRDLTFVSDTVDGFVRAANTPKAIGETLNLGTGRDVSIGELAEMILAGLLDQFMRVPETNC